MHHVYILHSSRADLYYTGNTDLTPEERLEEHNEGIHPKAATKRGIPWVIVLVILCSSRLQARQIEAHIKKMKSKKYIENLIEYPEMREKLLIRFE